MENVTIKNSWKEVTIAEFMQLQALNPGDFDTEIDYYIAVLSILSDKDANYFLSAPMSKWPEFISALSFMGTKPAGKVNTKYVINGKNYRVDSKIADLTAMQYIDLSTLLKDNDDNKNMHRILAVLMIENGKKYNTPDFDLDAAADEIRDHFNIADACALSLFFSMLLNVLIKAIASYSASQMRKAIKKETNPERREQLMGMRMLMKALANGGDGYTT